MLQPLILSLHRVGYPPANATHRNLFTSPRLLKFQLLFLKLLGFRFTTLRDSADTTGGRIAVVTFDDGYEDNVRLGLPILKKLDIPATVFVITEDVGAKCLSWEEAGEKLPADFMSWDSLGVLRDSGWEIGSHAHRHVHLARYCRDEQSELIKRSIKEIEANLGESPVSFAYPYGSYDDNTVDILSENGIQNAVTIEPTTVDRTSYGEVPLKLSRVALGGRCFHHYFKSIFKIFKATGISVLLPLPSFPMQPTSPAVVAD